MMLSDVRDYVESLGISENVYMGKLPDKPEKSIDNALQRVKKKLEKFVLKKNLDGIESV